MNDTLPLLWMSLGLALMGAGWIVASLKAHDTPTSTGAWMVGGLHVVWAWIMFCVWLGDAFIGWTAALLCIAPFLAAGFAGVIWPGPSYPGGMFE